jgi:hypothetical protein
MKNIHVIPTSKPSRIAITDTNVLGIYKVEQIAKYGTNQNIYITNLEEIKEGVDVKDKWVISEYGFVVKADKIENNYLIHSNGGSNFLHYYKFIILTTDQDLVGVQTIDDEFLKWFVKNPSCEFVEVEKGYAFGIFYKLIIPKEETLEEVVSKQFQGDFNKEVGKVLTQELQKRESETPVEWIYRNLLENPISIQDVEYNEAVFHNDKEMENEQCYSETEVLQLLLRLQQTESYNNLYEWFEQNKKK